MSKNIRKLVYCAVCIALSVVTGSLTLFELPNGGAITPFSMLFASLPGFFFGPYWGIFSGIAYGILSFVLKPYFLSVIQVICDYVLAFGALGLTGFFYKKNHGLFMGYTAACIGRFVFAVISGVAFFADYAPAGMNPLVYSMGYNGSYIFSEAIITLLVVWRVKPVYHAIQHIRMLANEDAVPTATAKI